MLISDIRYWKNRFIGVRPEILPKSKFIFKHMDSAQQIEKAKKIDSPAAAASFLLENRFAADEAMRTAVKKLGPKEANELLTNANLPGEVRFTISIRLKELEHANS